MKVTAAFGCISLQHPCFGVVADTARSIWKTPVAHLRSDPRPVSSGRRHDVRPGTDKNSTCCGT